MNEIKWCRDGGQHFWVTLPKGKGLQCYSCPMCEQVIYWSDASLSWVKPSTSGDRRIKGNDVVATGSSQTEVTPSRHSYPISTTEQEGKI